MCLKSSLLPSHPKKEPKLAWREAIPALSVQVQLTKEEGRKAIELYYDAMSMEKKSVMNQTKRPLFLGLAIYATRLLQGKQDLLVRVWILIRELPLWYRQDMVTQS